MPRARIFRPAVASQYSGNGAGQRWMLAFEEDIPRSIDPLMGWTGTGDTLQQVKLWFETKDEAIAYATRNGIAYRVEEPHEPKRKTMAYSDNFKFNRVGPWTH